MRMCPSVIRSRAGAQGWPRGRAEEAQAASGRAASLEAEVARLAALAAQLEDDLAAAAGGAARRDSGGEAPGSNVISAAGGPPPAVPAGPRLQSIEQTQPEMMLHTNGCKNHELFTQDNCIR